jgi:hypothetical protein
MYLDNLHLLARGIVLMLLIAIVFWCNILFYNIIKSKDSICDVEKQSKFILECLKEDKTKTVGAIEHCERMSIRLYCK